MYSHNSMTVAYKQYDIRSTLWFYVSVMLPSFSEYRVCTYVPNPSISQCIIN